MTFAWSRAIVAALLGASIFTLIGCFWPAANLWGTPEKPRQCEALTPEAARPGAKRLMTLYREEAQARTLRELQNTWSNLGFLLIGVYLLSAPGGRAIDRWMGAVLVYQFAASSLYHASLMPLFRDFDMAGVFAIAGLLSAMACAKCFPNRAGWLVSEWPASLAVIIIFATMALLRARVRIGDVLPLDTMVVLPRVGVMLFLAVVYAKIRGKDRRNLGIAALASFGVGLAAGGLDRVGQCLCAPNSWIQGHSVWHLCAAVSALLFCRWSAATRVGDA